MQIALLVRTLGVLMAATALLFSAPGLTQGTPAAAKARYDVFPSAYSNGHGVQVCKGKIKGLDGKKRCSGAYC